MKQLKTILAYIFKAVFLAPWFAYVAVILISGVTLWLLALRVSESSGGLAALMAVQLFFYICVAIAGLCCCGANCTYVPTREP